MVGLEYRNIDELAEADANPKTHDLDQLIASFSRWGFVLPLVEDARTSKLVAGHGRLHALKLMRADGLKPPRRIRVVDGIWFAPVLTGVEFANEDEAEAFLVADNRLVEIGGWDKEELKVMLAELSAAAVPIVGWTPNEIEQVLASTTTPAAEQAISEDESSMVKQVVLYYSSADFAKVVERLQKVAERLGVSDHTTVFLKLLDAHEANRG